MRDMAERAVGRPRNDDEGDFGFADDCDAKDNDDDDDEEESSDGGDNDDVADANAEEVEGRCAVKLVVAPWCLLLSTPAVSGRLEELAR